MHGAAPAMQGGFNTNIKYKGRTFHVQTEDSGHANPKIITLLYEGGVILTSKKSSYEDRVSAENLQSVVKELMEEQHGEMVRSLKAGLLDDVITGNATQSGAGGTGKKAAKSSRAPAFGEGIVTDRPLDELILTHLSA